MPEGGRMNFMKIHKKAVTLILIATFFYLIQISSMPLGAETSRTSGNETVNSAGNETGLIEQEAPAGYAKRKSSVLPIIIGVVAVGAIAAVLILVVFKTKYDITGTWSLIYNYPGQTTNNTQNTVFTGDKKSGTLAISTYADGKGKYTVDGKDVHFTMDSYATWIWDGKFTGKDSMSGTYTYPPNTPGTWTATRAATTTGVIEKKSTMIGTLEKR
jgi:hypothetical protein